MTRTAALSLLAVPLLAALYSGRLVQAAEQPAAPYPPGTIITVAGNGKAGFSGDGGPATNARLNNPLGLAVDASGNLFIGDAYNARVRRVSPDGTITTVVGSSPPGFTGDGGPAIRARLMEAAALTVDSVGDLFVSDFGNQRVRRVDASGTITTVVGGGHPADGVGDGGPATSAMLVSPSGLVVDPMGNLFVGDAAGRVRKVDAAGIITTVAGGGHPADGRGDGGLATAARLVEPLLLALDQAGNLYITDVADNRVRRVSPDGKITTVAGGGQPADGRGDGGPATDARLDNPNGMAVDAGGNLFIAENHGERIRKVSPAGIITTVAGTGQAGYSGDGGPAAEARLNSPTAVCIDRTGNLFFADGNRYAWTAKGGGGLVGVGNCVIREVIGVAVPR